MTRIIGGTAGGRRLQTPRGEHTRPTSDRVREALFSALESWFDSLEGLRVLDLYAGSGALGLEALSRGAAVATLVEQDRRTCGLVRTNARTLGLDGARVVTGAVGTVLAGGTSEPYDLVLSDPPYPLPGERVEQDLVSLVAHGWLAPGALVVLERAKRSVPLRWPAGLAPVRERRYGETVLWYGRADATVPEED